MTATATRPLHLAPNDGRPETALRPKLFDAMGILSGLLVIVVLPFVFLAMTAVLAFLTHILLLFLVMIGVVPDPNSEAQPEVLEEIDVIEARFVQLGREFEDQLPNRRTPVQSTALPEPSQIPREDTPVSDQETQHIEDRPPDTVDAMEENLDRRAELFEELARREEMEGSAEGIEEGTETEGTEGDVYRGRLYSFFRRGWSIPTTLAREEVEGLTTILDIEIGQNLEIVSFEIRQSSGNALFDESVIGQVARLKETDQHIPPPPEEVAGDYIGRTIAVRFSGRQAS
jgi:hypothetical protein